MNTTMTERYITLYSEHTPVLSLWSYHAEEPYTLSVAFRVRSDEWVHWVFARELLSGGLSGPAGIGDVRFVPFDHGEERYLLLQVESDKGHASWYLSRDDAIAFLGSTLELVPAESEEDFFDVDKLIAEIADV